MTRLVVYLSCALVIGLVSVSAQSNADATANAGTDASGTAVAEAQANAVADAIAWDVNNDNDSEECNAPDTTEATTTVANVPQCGDNEILDECPAKCGSDYCPKNEREASKSQLCVKPEKCPPPACKCRVNYRRNSKNVCIPTRECPPFKCSGVNEEFNPCPPFCPTDDCSQATPDGTCPKRFGRIGILLICSPKCRCMKGYWRKNGVCVPYAECNKNNQCSDPNEEYIPEKPSCPPEECNSIVARIDCTNAPPPAPGCACKSGYNRLNVTSPCIPQCQCPQLANSLECQATTGQSADVTEVTEPVTAEAPDTKEVSITTEPTEGESESLRCGVNEVPGRVRSCPPERTCRNRNIAFKCAVTPYVKKCVCATGYFRNSIGECITEAQCDQCSAPNQFYSCNSACDNECATIGRQNRTNCPIKNIVCNKKCYCDDGYARDANDNCVPVSECPKIEPGKYMNKDSLDSVCTDPNEHFTCQMPCPPETCSRLVIRIRCDEQQTCVPKCACKPGFYRVEEGSPCVGICDCPQMASAPMCNGAGGVLLPPPGFRV